MRAKFGLSLSNRAVLFGWATLDDLLEVPRAPTPRLLSCLGGGQSVVQTNGSLLRRCLPLPYDRTSSSAPSVWPVFHCVILFCWPSNGPVWMCYRTAHHSGCLQRWGRRDCPQFAHELEVMGVASSERVGLTEGITILRRLWSAERCTHAGKYYQFADVELLPKPVQQPLIYLAVNPKVEHVSAAVIDRILRRVATYGDGWQTDATPVDTFRQRFRDDSHLCCTPGTRCHGAGVLPASHGQYQRRPRAGLSGSHAFSRVVLWCWGSVTRTCRTLAGLWSSRRR